MIDSGIAAADAICCSRLGVYSAGESHNEAIVLLENAEPDVAKHLRTLLNFKSKVVYSHRPVTTDDHKKASRAASKLPVASHGPQRAKVDDSWVFTRAHEHDVLMVITVDRYDHTRSQSWAGVGAPEYRWDNSLLRCECL